MLLIFIKFRDTSSSIACTLQITLWLNQVQHVFCLTGRIFLLILRRFPRPNRGEGCAHERIVDFICGTRTLWCVFIPAVRTFGTIREELEYKNHRIQGIYRNVYCSDSAVTQRLLRNRSQKNKIENWSNTAFGRARHKDSININSILVLKRNKGQIIHCSKNQTTSGKLQVWRGTFNFVDHHGHVIFALWFWIVQGCATAGRSSVVDLRAR